MFRYLCTTKGNCRHITIRDRKSGKIPERIENSKLLSRKAKISWQFEKLQNHKDLNEKTIESEAEVARAISAFEKLTSAN